MAIYQQDQATLLENSHLQDRLHVAEELPISKIQTYISELFRLQLCRNDDHNLAQSSLLKNMHFNLKHSNQAAKSSAIGNKIKLIDDMKVREEERVKRETEILVELGGEANQKNLTSNQPLMKHLIKFVKKMLMLTVTDQYQAKITKQQFLLQNFPSYLHLASIMEERTDSEKDTFGKVELADLSEQWEQENPALNNHLYGNQHMGGNLSDDQIIYIIKVYTEDLKDPKELLNQCIQRSRDRYQREHAKMNAYQVQQGWFTEEGVKDRAQSLRFKILLKERHPEIKRDSDLKNMNQYDKVLTMFILHNQKVEKQRSKYTNEIAKKKRAKEQGITLKELEEKEGLEAIGLEKPAEKSKNAGFGSRSKSKGRKKDNFEIVIKMKDEDGKVQDYDQNEDEEAAPIQSEENDSKKGKAIQDKEENKTTKIEAEDTLDMIQQALGGNFGDQNQAASKPWKKTTAKKATTTKKKKKEDKVDSIQRFFNNYSENPHLQQIENGYLKYLEAQHAKESHLKAIKKFQILHALKRIQRYWKVKYQELRKRAARKIQAMARKFIKKMNAYRQHLLVIKTKQLRIKLKKALLLYIKKRRAQKGYLRPNILEIARRNPRHVAKIQGASRVLLAKRSLFWRKYLKYSSHPVLQTLFLKKFVSRLTRDKETYWIQRYSLGQIESNQIQKYIKQTEKKFEANWKQYEDQLEKYLTSKSQGEFKDWIQRKDDNGKVYWTNTTTLKSQMEHPGQRIFQINKKMLKNKAQQELDSNLSDIQERRYVIMEAIIGLKGKVSTDMAKTRMDSALQTKTQRAAWRRRLQKQKVAM